MRCGQCNSYQVHIGTIAITMPEEQFKGFKNYINTTCIRAGDEADGQRFAIPTPDPAINMVLTKKEIKHLLYMLEQADTEVKALSLLRLFRA